ncbi:hypothetical protein [Streptomyces indicus]|uniref:Uncharacterized protein n=1 Tax=Streptomyces indicus TaxID=417292 RepID=A0A1G9IW26_9ACTN|nr:hypothetical protein [Streptomyces indicus]SDL29034.1 hypothetical protein SAMN05421806_12584 [Streptomyces indicus]
MSAPAPERPIADVVESEFIQINEIARRIYGPVETQWTDSQWTDYVTVLATASREAGL